MIFIIVRHQVLSPYADRWSEIVAEFTSATRAEPGCLWFGWSRSLDDPNELILVEAFRDDEAAAAHVRSSHFTRAMQILPSYLAERPRIINVKVPQDDWSELTEMVIPERH